MARKLFISKEKLEYLYLTKELPRKEILNKLGIKKSCLYYWLGKYNIQKRPIGVNTLITLKIYKKKFKGKNNPMFGKKHSEETLNKIKNSNYHTNCSNINNSNWKGGVKKSNGYVYILSPNHPNCHCDGYVKRATLVIEKNIGRYLKKGEEIHHKGAKYPVNSIENKSDDRLENLQLFSSKGEHSAFHHKLRKLENKKGLII